MNIFVCLDSDGGMLFNNRRQSKDSAVRAKMFEITAGQAIFMNAYSARQFNESDNIIVGEDFINIVGEDDFCFIENVDMPVNGVKNLYIFNWNRKYPSDVKFDYDMAGKGFIKLTTEEFAGSSHEKITLEVYGRK